MPELTGNRAANINLDNINSGDDAKAALQAVARMSDDFTEVVPGNRTGG